VHDGGITDDFKREQLDCPADIVAAHTVLISLDRCQHQMIDRSDCGERITNFLGSCEIEGETVMLAANLGSGRLRAFLVAPCDDHLFATSRQSVCDRAADSGCSADNQGAYSIGHTRLPV